MSWDKVDGSAHIKPETLSAGHAESVDRDISRSEETHATDEELNAIFLRTYGKSKRDEAIRRSQKAAAAARLVRQKARCLLSGQRPEKTSCC